MVGGGGAPPRNRCKCMYIACILMRPLTAGALAGVLPHHHQHHPHVLLLPPALLERLLRSPAARREMRRGTTASPALRRERSSRPACTINCARVQSTHRHISVTTRVTGAGRAFLLCSLRTQTCAAPESQNLEARQPTKLPLRSICGGRTLRMAPMWLPLESNPDVLNGYAWKLGLSDTFAFHDIYGLDPDLLGMVRVPPRLLREKLRRKTNNAKC